MSKYQGLQGSFAAQLEAFAEAAKEAADLTFQEVMIELGNSLIRMSPVGNPDGWKANVEFQQANTRAADEYDYNVAIRNTIINLDDRNFTKGGRLKRGVKYAKPLTKAERDQNFNVNGLVAGKGYVGGRFRGNWQFSIETPAEDTLDIVDPTGRIALADLKTKVAGLTAGETAYIVNNLPYAIPLEYGHSKQAPAGMVRVTVARFQAIVEEAIRNNQV